VTGVDSSEPLIELCRQRFPEQEWVVADMRTLDLGRHFAGIIAWHSFFHLSPEDQETMFPVFEQHAGSGAALMFTSGPEHGSVLSEFEGEPLYHGSLNAEEYGTLLDQTGFAVVEHVAEDPTCGEATIWLAQKRAEGGALG